MIKKKILFLCFILIVASIAINLKVTNSENEISRIIKKKDTLQFDIDLNEVNWAYITRPENLYKLNKKNYEYQPILFSDLINLQIDYK
jgi:hypothetical protein